MAIILVTYDLKKAGQNYQGVHDFLKRFAYCKGLESVWLLDTTTPVATIRDALQQLTDANDVLFVVRLQRDWASAAYGCAEWLNKPERSW